MRRISILVAGLFLLLWLVSLPPATTCAMDGSCTTIQSGTLTDVNGNPLTTRYDQWGYNYQAHMYNGLYANFQRPSPPYTDENCASYGAGGCDDLQMKWNDAWLSNQSCDGDAKLDRYFGYPSYIGSGAWLTNHQSGTYTMLVDGKEKLVHWTYFVKIVAVPSDAVACADASKWCTADGTEIGPKIWGAFAIIQEVYNDPFSGAHGVLYKSPQGPGFGIYGNNP